MLRTGYITARNPPKAQFRKSLTSRWIGLKITFPDRKSNFRNILFRYFFWYDASFSRYSWPNLILKKKDGRSTAQLMMKGMFFSIVSKYVYQYKTFHEEKSPKNMLQPWDTRKSKMAARRSNSSPMAPRPKILVSIIGFSGTADTLVPFKNVSLQYFTRNPRWRPQL